MRKIIAALIVSLDGYIEGVNEELDWIDSWEDPFEITGQVDTFILGSNMYPGYEQYWSAVHAAPHAPLPFSEKPATPGELAYADFAMRTPHVVLSTSMHATAWKHTRIVRHVDDIRALKQGPGKDMHAVGGGVLVSSLINEGLVDELRLVVVPVLLGAGKSLFQNLQSRHRLTFVSATPLNNGHTKLIYRFAADRSSRPRQLFLTD
jgi:dihydrofolate reductase